MARSWRPSALSARFRCRVLHQREMDFPVGPWRQESPSAMDSLLDAATVSTAFHRRISSAGHTDRATGEMKP